ncbi:MAG TPA: endo-1,3-alpha-glucanase family glycosylhydrolase, partial [Rugosimonospora sp.]|nr:endo-1,3-alpha-glucanase family glycosylhydrolase [Rugosimonospora sp.]
MSRRLLTALLAVALALPVSGAPATGQPSAPPAAVPVLAFYYIWFDPSSWNRAKTDYPQLGDYSSDDPRVLRQHILWAESAGIDGFIVSWKDTPTNNRRLRLLMGLAAQLDFKLAMIYQGLDFSRKPLPASRVAADFVTFRDQFAGDPVFYRLGGKPLTIWSGTWAYSHADVAAATGPVRGRMLVLNTEKSLDGYRRIADVTDGDAYYWSSVNPDTNTSYGGKLTDLSRAIHQNHQYWLAPFAPGFDARLVGGSKAVPRKDGQTLRDEYATALASSPDVLGLISWNEFSENSYVEPSQRYGTRYLDVLRDLRHSTVPVPPSASDSSAPPPAASGAPRGGLWPLFVL